MEKLAAEYNRFLTEEAPELLEVIIFSKTLGKWCLLYHTINHETTGIHVLEGEEEMAEEFLIGIAFHTKMSQAYRESNILRQIEMLKEAL